MSRVIWDCCDFLLLSSVIGPENSRHRYSQSDLKLMELVFSRTSGSLIVFLFEFSLAPCAIFHSFDWPLSLLLFFLNDTQSKCSLVADVTC